MRITVRKTDRQKETLEEVPVKYEREERVNEHGDSGSRFLPYCCDLEDCATSRSTQGTPG